MYIFGDVVQYSNMDRPYLVNTSCSKAFAFFSWCWLWCDMINGFNGDLGQDLVDLRWVPTGYPSFPHL